MGLIGSRLFHASVAYSRGRCGLFSQRVTQSTHSCIFTPKTCYYAAVIPTRQNKAREALFFSSRVNYCPTRQTRNSGGFCASQPYSSNSDGGAGSGMIENSTLGRCGSIRLSATILVQRLSFVIAPAYCRQSSKVFRLLSRSKLL